MNDCHQYLKIGIDFHGVINANQHYFKIFCELALKRGHEIHILSGGPEEKIVTQLEKAQIKYSKVFTIFDFYNDKGMACLLPNGQFHIDENLWNETKAEYCRQNGIDIQIDDSLIYGKYFTTPYCLYDNEKKQCTITENNQVIEFNDANPILAIQQLEKYLINN